MSFDPWNGSGMAVHHEDGRISATLSLREDLGMHLECAEISCEGTMLSVTFRKNEEMQGVEPQFEIVDELDDLWRDVDDE